MLYLGIDQHRKQLTVSLRDESGDVVLKRQVSTQWDRVRQFFTQLAEMAAKQEGFMAIVEVCGFNDWLLKLLREYGCRETVLAQPETRAVKKTDRRDAGQLSQLLWLNRERLRAGKKVQGLRRVTPPSADDAADRQLTALRKRLGDFRTRTLNKVQRLLMKHNLGQECPVKRLQTKAARKWLQELTLGEMDRMELNLLLAQWEIQDRQIEELQKQIVERQRRNPMAGIIATAPGMQAYSSLAVASRIGNIENFPRSASLASYWGLTPGCRNSGEATERLGSITKQGSAMVRFILGQVILHVLRRDPLMKAWYLRIKKRRGAKIARVAAMRRLATILWHMVKHSQPYHIGQMMHLGQASAPSPTAPVQTSPATAGVRPAGEHPVFKGMAGQENDGTEKRQKRPRSPKRPEPDGSFPRPDSVIPRRVAPQQSPTLFHRAPTKIRK
jgi:transposase